MKKRNKPDDIKPDPLAQAAGDFVSKLYDALENYMRRSDEILEEYIASGRRRD